MTLTCTNFYQLLDDPLTFVVSAGSTFEAALSVCVEKAAGGIGFILVVPAWNLHGIQQTTFPPIRRLKSQFPLLSFTFLCPTLGEVQLARRRGFEGLHIHHNAFLDERIHCLIPTMEKKFDAVHIASLQEFKRHELAWKVPRIAVVTYGATGKVGVEPENAAHFIEGYQDLAYCNYQTGGDHGHLTPHEVSEVVRSAYCGLILSAQEGANFASTEYMLAGIPVVSTPSIGGRSEFYDDRFVKIVPPNEDDVMRAVQSWKSNPANPVEVRKSVLGKMCEHRRRLLAWLCAISDRDLFSDATDNFWNPIFTNKLRESVLVDFDPNKFAWSTGKKTSRFELAKAWLGI